MTGRIFHIERFAIHDGPGIRVAVFFKGCPLRCLWCHSPESQSATPDFLFKADRCLRCGTCVSACPTHAIVKAEAGEALAFETLRDRCDACGECLEACPSGARSIAGYTLTVADLINEVVKDRVFFDRSGGGVTFSGGEPLMQPAFLSAAINACRERGIHTAIETSGYGSRIAIDAAARANLVLFDLKLFDDRRHRRATGVSNRIIIKNFTHLARVHPAVRVRVPLVPGINDDAANLDAIAALAASAGVTEIDLLPYHTAGSAKYARLDRPYPLSTLRPSSPEAVSAAGERLARLGATVHIGG
jgi:pyruvate formate lyase activating enzyme